MQSFYTISPLKAPMDLDYSELDWEYLPNGGWGIDGPTLYSTTWETFSPEPNWKKDNVFKTTNGERGGWHADQLHRLGAGLEPDLGEGVTVNARFDLRVPFPREGRPGEREPHLPLPVRRDPLLPAEPGPFEIPV